jgi:uncharacterized membrane protein YebE (DUF533 family)
MLAMDAASLLGGMLSSSFGSHHRRSLHDGVGLGSMAVGVAGAAAVGGLGYLAYQHFANRGAVASPMQPSLPRGPAQQGMTPQGGLGGMLGGIAGGTNDLERGGFSVPGYEWQRGAAGAPTTAPGGPAGAPAPSWGPGPQGWSTPTAPTAPGWGGPAAPAAPPDPHAKTWTADDYRALPARPASPFGPAEEGPHEPTSSIAAPSTAADAGRPVAAPLGSPDFPAAAPTAAPVADRDALLLVRAMVAAASADGVIDDAERASMLDRLTSAGAGPAERAALEAEMRAPRQVSVLAAEVSSAELAKQFYAVSLLAMKIDTDAERAYAKMLPLLLRLGDAETREIEVKLGVTVPR